jgi:hypothetical protein
VLGRVTFVLAVLAIKAGFASAGTYSRLATTVPLMGCDSRRCKAVVAVQSPDGARTVRRTFNRSAKDRLKIPNLYVITPKGAWDLVFGNSMGPWVDTDVLWSPDSRFIALSGNTNGYLNSIRIFQIRDSGVEEIDAAREPFEDMLRRFPPCRAADRTEPEFCREISKHQEYLNFSAIAWADDHTLVLMGEVPCESRWGGIMCQVMGYEVELPSGRIARTMTASEFKVRWQKSMAWRFHIPEPPEWQH